MQDSRMRAPLADKTVCRQLGFMFCILLCARNTVSGRSEFAHAICVVFVNLR